jgi:hypothetical protein
MNKIISVRDDDINYFTNPAQLEGWYEPIFDRIKPTLCVTPYAGEIYHSVRKSENIIKTKVEKIKFVKNLYENNNINEIKYSIYENKTLIELLKKWCKEGKVEISLHGITHNQTPYGFECEGEPPSFEKFIQTLSELEKELGASIKTFSLPNNSIRRPWMKLLKRSKLDIVHSLGPKPWETQINIDTVLSQAKVLKDIIINGRNSRLNKPLSLGEISFIQSIPLSQGNRADKIIQNLKKINEKGGGIVIATHSYAFDYAPELYSDLILLLDYAHENKFSLGTLQDQLK